MNSEVEFHIRHNYAWPKLPQNVRQVLLLARLDVCLLVYIGHPQKTGLSSLFAPYVCYFFIVHWLSYNHTKVVMTINNQYDFCHYSKLSL